MNELEVTIFGREYRLVCADHERADLLAAVDRVDQLMRQLKEEKKIVGADRIAIMTAVQLAHELITLKSVTPETQQAYEKNIVDSEEIRHRLRAMNDLVSSVLAPQEKLF